MCNLYSRDRLKFWRVEIIFCKAPHVVRLGAQPNKDQSIIPKLVKILV